MNQEKKIILSKIIEEKEKNFSHNSSDQEAKTDLFKTEEDNEGQLLMDVYKKDNNIIIKTVVAGVKPEDIDISLKNDIITLRGKRFLEEKILEEDYYCSECYWGKFSRSIVLPFKVDERKLEAILKNGILTIILPKIDTYKKQKIKIKEAN